MRLGADRAGGGPGAVPSEVSSKTIEAQSFVEGCLSTISVLKPLEDVAVEEGMFGGAVISAGRRRIFIGFVTQKFIRGF